MISQMIINSVYMIIYGMIMAMLAMQYLYRKEFKMIILCLLIISSIIIPNFLRFLDVPSIYVTCGIFMMPLFVILFSLIDRRKANIIKNMRRCVSCNSLFDKDNKLLYCLFSADMTITYFDGKTYKYKYKGNNDENIYINVNIVSIYMYTNHILIVKG